MNMIETIETIEDRKARLESYLSTLLNIPVELTIRWENSFTLSTDGDHVELLKTAVRGLRGTVEGADFDEECDQTCVWFHFDR